jgi:hypothetical protein
VIRGADMSNLNKKIFFLKKINKNTYFLKKIKIQKQKKNGKGGGPFF